MKLKHLMMLHVGVPKIMQCCRFIHLMQAKKVKWCRLIWTTL